MKTLANFIYSKLVDFFLPYSEYDEEALRVPSDYKNRAILTKEDPLIKRR